MKLSESWGDNRYDRSLGYDNINRLTSAIDPWGSGSISYDGAGNITRQALGAWSLSYSYSSNQLSRVSGTRSVSYGHDAYGNITRTGGATYRCNGAPHLLRQPQRGRIRWFGLPR